MMQVSVNPTDVILSPSPATWEPMGWYGHICDVIAQDSGEVIGRLMLGVHKAGVRLHMKLEGHVESVMFDDPESMQDVIDTLAARLNLAVDWEATGKGL